MRREELIDCRRLWVDGSLPVQIIDTALAAMDERDEAIDMVLVMFTQACWALDGKYYHNYISAYEDAQAYLIERGKIKPEECMYGD